jgi:hypothetical protein
MGLRFQREGKFEDSPSRETGRFNCPLQFAKMRDFQGIFEKQKNILSTDGGTIPDAKLENIEHRTFNIERRILGAPIL